MARRLDAETTHRIITARRRGANVEGIALEINTVEDVLLRWLREGRRDRDRGASTYERRLFEAFATASAERTHRTPDAA